MANLYTQMKLKAGSRKTSIIKRPDWVPVIKGQPQELCIYD
jgi:hypothetical protein